jgi:hypothetical protein
MDRIEKISMGMIMLCLSVLTSFARRFSTHRSCRPYSSSRLLLELADLQRLVRVSDAIDIALQNGNVSRILACYRVVVAEAPIFPSPKSLGFSRYPDFGSFYGMTAATSQRGTLVWDEE